MGLAVFRTMKDSANAEHLPQYMTLHVNFRSWALGPWSSTTRPSRRTTAVSGPWTITSPMSTWVRRTWPSSGTQLWPGSRSTTVAWARDSVGTVQSRLDHVCEPRVDAAIIETVRRLSRVRVTKVALVEEAAGWPIGRSWAVEGSATDSGDLVLERPFRRWVAGSREGPMNRAQVAVIIARLVDWSFLRHVSSRRRPRGGVHRLVLSVDRRLIQRHSRDVQHHGGHRWTASLHLLRAAGRRHGRRGSRRRHGPGPTAAAQGLPQRVPPDHLLLVPLTGLERSEDEEWKNDKAQDAGRYYNDDDDWQPDHAHVDVWI